MSGRHFPAPRIAENKPARIENDDLYEQRLTTIPQNTAMIMIPGMSHVAEIESKPFNSQPERIAASHQQGKKNERLAKTIVIVNARDWLVQEAAVPPKGASLVFGRFLGFMAENYQRLIHEEYKPKEIEHLPIIELLAHMTRWIKKA